MGTAKTIKFEGTRDECVAAVLSWAEVDELWDEYQLDERIDVLDLLSVPGCDVELDDLDSENPGQCDEWMTVIITDEIEVMKSIWKEINETINPPRKTSHLRLVKG